MFSFSVPQLVSVSCNEDTTRHIVSGSLASFKVMLKLS
jgi:hypothetical protein